MKHPNPIGCRYGSVALFVCLFLFFSACSTFPKGVRMIRQNKLQEAERLFEKAVDHRTYGPGARFYLGRLHINQDQNTLPWLGIHEDFCELEAEVRTLPVRQITRLARYDASRPDIMNAREKLRNRIVDRMSTDGTVSQLLVLEDSQDCWPEPTVDTLRTIVVNKTLNPAQPVYSEEIDAKWKGTPFALPLREEVRLDNSRSCRLWDAGRSFGVTYEEATAIAERYPQVILPGNYNRFWSMQENIWDIFQIHESYCDMSLFQQEHPRDGMAQDCWFDTARDTLCLGRVRPLLAFHRNNPHTALDIDICDQILCLMLQDEEAALLNAAEQKQVEDILLMLRLQQQLLFCRPEFDSLELINKVAYLARDYQHHRVIFDLAIATCNYFARDGKVDLSRTSLETFRPLYPDSSVCNPGHYFQEQKQQWFDNFEALLEQAEEQLILPEPVMAWNTPTHDEYALVSWGETDEVFFVRKDREDGTAQMMTSYLEDEEWTEPVPVGQLSISNDVEPLSMSADGRRMLLRAKGQLLRAFRPQIDRPWLEPSPMPVPQGFAGNAWISPDDSLLVMEQYSGQVRSRYRPQIDLIAAKLGKYDRYGRPVVLPAALNLEDEDEIAPMMALGGRLLFFASGREGGLGGWDMYSIALDRPGDWSTLGEAKNLGFSLNTIFNEDGMTYFSEYTGQAYFHRYDQCAQDVDIWRVKLGPGVFPDNALRLAGLVIDENRTPIGGGFMEFTPDYQLNVHSRGISEKGTYTYTVPDTTEVIRLFPEIPGYYSENDATHFMADMPRGEIIRDTFMLISFEYIRQNFRLVHSTFFNGTAEFDQPTKAYPELTRLAKIATRMGAELELTGHTDGTGAEAGNQELSTNRAESVKQYLVEKCGFDPERIRTYGYGASKPICSNDTEEGRRCNRRVEIVFKMPELAGW